MRAQCVLTALCCLAFNSVHAAQAAAPLVIGETFTLQSKVLERDTTHQRLSAARLRDAPDQRFPVLYMPDGGLAEDFPARRGARAGLRRQRHDAPVRARSASRTPSAAAILPVLRRTKQTRKIAPRVGGSAAFRKFLRDELMPDVKARYRTTDETAIVGESLAGLFVVETFSCWSRTCSMRTSRSIRACGGTMAPSSRARLSGCAPCPSGQVAVVREQQRRNAATERNACTGRCRRRADHQDCSGASSRCPPRSIRRSTIPPRSWRFASYCIHERKP
jgi:hypothetical protein